ncbi:MAG: hypothetical protein COT06_05855 [Syntrophobacteraceae bacterium CG07_land_8_20_14_0_80_61_8]|nr:MAG: hypothetical protein COT06_05855 [Syntrophobacteraceae bacterium CG07_land_8_20_14_0_80_61_8]
MHGYRVETTVSSQGSLIIKGLPFQAGDKVEVIIRRHKHGERKNTCYPLRGKPIRYADPFGSVGEEDWETLR